MTSPRLRTAFRRNSALFFCSLLAFVSCNETTTPLVLTTLNVSLAASSVQAGQSTTATVAGVDQNGASIAIGSVTWSTGSPTIATVNASSGAVTGIAPGTVLIIAKSGGITGQQTLTVTPPPPVLTTINVAVSPSSITLGQTTTATAAGVDQYGGAISPGTVTWSSATPAIATVNPTTGVATGVAAGSTQIIATAGSKSGQQLITVTSPPAIKVNEVESNGGTPGDWVELMNTTTAPVNVSGWVFRDNDPTHAYAIPAGTTIPAGGYLVVEEASFGFGLGGADEATLLNQFGVTVDTYSWTAHAATTYARCPNGSGAFVTSTASTKGAVNDCRPPVRVNEVESNGGTPGDWIELYNAGTTAVNLSGFVVTDNDPTHISTIPAGTIIAAGGFYVVEEAALGFGLGGADDARLFDPAGLLVDSHTWTAHAALTYGRCPDGTGAFASTSSSTKGATNVCTAGPVIGAWPGADDVQTVDGVSVFQTNLSGLTYEAAGGGQPAVLWAVRNGPGTLYRLIFNGTIWTPDAANNWGSGKALRYTDNLGNPDAEGVTFAAGGSAGGIYVATERNNDASTISRSSVLRFDPLQAGAELRATNDWNLTADLPVVGANLGIEAITWIPDTYLTARGFFDETKGHAYLPSEYPDHGTGLFFVGVEGNGNVYVYAFNHVTNGISRIAVFSGGNPGIMDLHFDRDVGTLWGYCDDTCGNLAGILEIDVTVGSPTRGRFKAPRQFNRPPSMPNINNEGFTMAPESECVAGRKFAYWADDGETGGHSIRRASIQCGAISAAPMSLRAGPLRQPSRW